ncbi:MAG: hypothetical protein E7187_07030 [Erysipelotrichaceae bacterium]|nr:hypothetical protein [Erysipelotrichaceae bacterium]
MINKHYDDYLDLTLDTEIRNCIREKDSYLYEFEDTVFYFENGGQHSDHGTINGIEVSDLIVRDGHYYHVLPEKLETVVCHMEVDRDFRQKQAEIHSASHLLCSLINRNFNARTIAFYNDSYEAYVEMSFETMNRETIQKIEDMCNEYILKDIPVEIEYPAYEEVKDKFTDVKLAHDILRTVRIDGIDYDMCGCTHVPSLRYLGMLKIFDFEKTSRGYKLYYLVGKMLRERIALYSDILESMSADFAVPTEKVPEAVSRIRQDLRDSRLETEEYKEYYLESVAERYINSDERIVFGQFDFDIKALNKLATMVVSNSSKLVFFISNLGEKMHLVIARSKDLEIDAAVIFKDIALAHGLRGGGNRTFAQGGGLNDPGLLFELTARYGSIELN